MRRKALIVAAVVVVGGIISPAGATPEGRNGRIAFRRYLNKAQTRGAIFTIRRHGTGVRQITHPRRGFVTDEPDWSPNGRWIVYQRETQPPRGFSRLYKIRPNGSNRTYLSTACGRICGDGYASWFPGGKRLALQRGACGTVNTLMAVYVMRANGSQARRVTQKNATCANRHRYSDTAPTVAPRGKRLVFERVDEKRGKNAIFSIRLDGTGLRRLTPWRIDASQPDWSPNGRWIAFRTQEHSETRGNIALVHPDGSGFHRITHSRGKHKWLSCSFSPNGKKIQAGRFPGRGKAGNADVYVMNLDGTGRRNVTKSGSWESGSDWGPRRRG
jgi:TolB protein